MQGIIKQLEACHSHIANRLRHRYDAHDWPVPEDIEDMIVLHKALLDRLKARDESLELGAQCANEREGGCRGFKTPEGE